MIQAPWLTEDITNKFKAAGQDPDVYIEGLMHSKYVTYWDYIQVDTLLTLQKTKTDFPDEEIFIMYHQVTELYFKMILHELRQIADKSDLDKKFFIERVKRIDRYFGVLATSFGIMRDGMDAKQYMKFRTALTPASGFQSVQYRMIEICSTDLWQLVDKKLVNELPHNASIEQMLQNMYWQAAGKDPKTGDKTLTLSLFETKYMNLLVQVAKEYQHKNLRARFRALPIEDQEDAELVEALRGLDKRANVDWPQVHMKTAEKYLESNGKTKEATGGSNWKKYLHPKFQRRIYFPELWSKKELEQWGQ